MTSRATALQLKPENDNNDQPQFVRGADLFNQITNYLTAENIGYQNVETESARCQSCISITNEQGRSVFISFDFGKAAAFGRKMEFSVSVTNTPDNPAAIEGHDGKRLIMTTNRGVNGFKDRFSHFMSEFCDKPFRPLKFNQL